MEKEGELFIGCKGLGLLRVWYDQQPRTAALNMAIDEVLLRRMDELDPKMPIVRFYDWARPAVSIGYFQRWLETVEDAERAELDLVRRWTGGGRVDHREDVTYTLVLDREHPLFFMPPADNYRWVHRCVVGALQQIGARALVSDTANTFSPRGDNSPNCFDSPVQFDVVDDDGGKVAGAAQRRTRWGLLHQGSVMGSGIEGNRKDWENALAELLAGSKGEVKLWNPPEAWLLQAEEVAAEKYALQSWQEKF